MSSTPLKYIAELNHVRELGLFGSADLDWWRRNLKDESVEPLAVDGKAQLLVTGLLSKWAMRPFIDFSVMISAKSTFGDMAEGLFIVGAYNASRFIVFFEDKWFRLPYQFRADISMNLGGSWAYQIGDRNPDCVVELSTRTVAEEKERHEAFDQKIPLFLPMRGNKNIAKWLMVRVRGKTSHFEFDKDRDRFEVSDDVQGNTLACLRESAFRPRRWHIRRDGSHARTTTIKTPI